MAYAGAKPWHKLGTQVPNLMTTQEALLASHLDWDVEKVPVLSSKDLSVVPNSYTVVRKDTDQPLGIVGNRYEPISNREAFSFFDAALGKDQGQIDTIGALGQGERVWCMAKMPEVHEVLPNDPVERYLLCWTSHDGSKSMEVMFTNIRVVCNNTLTAAIRGAKTKVSMKHTKNWEHKLKMAHNMLHESSLYWDKMKKVSTHLAQTSISRIEVGAFLDAMFPDRLNQKNELVVNEGRHQVVRLMDEGRGSDIKGVRGTKWGLYNAYTEYLDHEQKIRKGQNRWERSVFGVMESKRDKAVDLLLSK
jgi:phage/plasmid-like protein (TIGR03299 family)